MAKGPSANEPDDEFRLMVSHVVPPEMQAAWGAPDTTVGSWAEYQLVGGPTDEQHPLRVRFAVVPPSFKDDRLWFEVRANYIVGGLTILGLFRGDPTQPKRIERLLLKHAGQAALEIPLLGLGIEVVLPRPLRSDVKIKRSPAETVEVPAGKFRAERLVHAGSLPETAWYSHDVPLFGLVKIERGRQTVVLVGSGRAGATPDIDPGSGE